MKEFLIPAVIAVIIAIAFFLGVFGSASIPVDPYTYFKASQAVCQTSAGLFHDAPGPLVNRDVATRIRACRDAHDMGGHGQCLGIEARGPATQLGCIRTNASDPGKHNPIVAHAAGNFSGRSRAWASAAYILEEYRDAVCGVPGVECGETQTAGT